MMATAIPKFLRFPTILGAVVPVYSLPDMPVELRFTQEGLHGIYLGKIRRWNDPRIRAANRDVMLLNREVAVIHRSDGSGTSYVWTDYLSKVSLEGKAVVGVNRAPQWPPAWVRKATKASRNSCAIRRARLNTSNISA